MSQSRPATARSAQDNIAEPPPIDAPAGEMVRRRPKERHLPEEPGDVIRRLLAEGWLQTKKGKGDHKNFRHPNKKGKVTVDEGMKEIPIGTLRSVYRQAGWEW